MERRNFLKLLGLGTVGAVAAATAFVETATAATPVDRTLDQVAERNQGEGEFAQRRRRMRRRVMRRRHRMMRRHRRMMRRRFM